MYWTLTLWYSAWCFMLLVRFLGACLEWLSVLCLSYVYRQSWTLVWQEPYTLSCLVLTFMPVCFMAYLHFFSSGSASSVSRLSWQVIVHFELAVVAHTCSSVTLRTEAGGLWIWGQSGLLSDIVFQKNKLTRQAWQFTPLIPTLGGRGNPSLWVLGHPVLHSSF